MWLSAVCNKQDFIQCLSPKVRLRPGLCPQYVSMTVRKPLKFCYMSYVVGVKLCVYWPWAHLYWQAQMNFLDCRVQGRPYKKRILRAWSTSTSTCYLPLTKENNWHIICQLCHFVTGRQHVLSMFVLRALKYCGKMLLCRFFFFFWVNLF